MLLCGICQTESPDDAHHCPNCGEASWVAPIANGKKLLPKRGALKPSTDPMLLEGATTETINAIADGAKITPDPATVTSQPLNLTEEERATLPVITDASGDAATITIIEDDSELESASTTTDATTKETSPADPKV